MWSVSFFVLGCLAFAQGQTTTNYCDPPLCSGSVHIACNNDGSFSSACHTGREIISITSFQSLILNKHNTYRNRIAGGNLTGFKPAVRMATIRWDSELAKLAELNVKQCEISHDQCRNTINFKFAGQNLAADYGIPAPSAESVISSGIDGWFSEHKDASQTNMDRFQSANAVIEHFTSMVNDRATHIGCALLRQPRDNGAEFFFACNYAQNNILGIPIYVSGTAASKCTTGQNTEYPNLCSTVEAIDPNSIEFELS